MTSEKRKELRRLLGTLEGDRELEKERARQARIQQKRFAGRFEELRQGVLMPILRETVLELERRGHLARLRARGPERLRLDVQLERPKGVRPRRGAIEFTLLVDPPGRVRIAYGWGWDEHQETCALEELDREYAYSRLLKLLEGLI